MDTGNWLLRRLLLIHPSGIDDIDDGAETGSVHLARNQIQGSPDIAADRPVSQLLQRDICGSYGCNPTWGDTHFGAGTMGMQAFPPNYIDRDTIRAMGTIVLEKMGDPHLRSLNTVRGYHFLATDGEIGQRGLIALSARGRPVCWRS